MIPVATTPTNTAISFGFITFLSKIISGRDKAVIAIL
jgi:hypothetical protein